LAVLRQIGRELIGLGAVLDPELANAVALLAARLPRRRADRSAGLIEVCKLQ
jgi:hypothetical protein